MTVEVSAVCPAPPDIDVVVRLTELLLGVASGGRAPVSVRTSDHGSLVALGSAATTFVTTAPPGDHEFADAWVVTADDRDRTPESRLLSLAVALSAATVSRGRILDEVGWLRTTDTLALVSSIVSAPSSDAGVVLARVLNG
jgi:hypothetical protein